ncbi:MAG: hypothetical protein ACI9FB_003058 [Candidatus Azotimanducaceae bacterium]|jgi:hypothetical protein
MDVFNPETLFTNSYTKYDLNGLIDKTKKSANEIVDSLWQASGKEMLAMIN